MSRYHAERHDPLLWLADLSRRDKHRTLNLVVARAGFMDERLETGLQGWAAHLAGKERKRAVIKSPAGEIKNEMDMKAVFEIALEDCGRLDWALDGIGSRLSQIIQDFRPTFDGIASERGVEIAAPSQRAAETQLGRDVLARWHVVL